MANLLSSITNAKKIKIAQGVTLCGSVVTLMLAIVKIFFGLKGQSHALFADGLHSLADLFIDTLVLFASFFGSQHADEEHPYGHGRIETAATLALAMILILTGAGIIFDAYDHLKFHGILKPSLYVFWIAAASIIANELLFYFTFKMGEKIKSKLLIANAWHHRGDSASSFVVVIGVTGSFLGYLWLDTFAAVIVGLMIIQMAWSLGWSSMKELIDTGVPIQTVSQIKKAILNVSGVLELHQLRTRLAADKILVDVHVLVDPRLSVSEGHYIAADVTRKLHETFELINDVTVHIDYESDDDFSLTEKIPSREHLEILLKQYWSNLPFFENIIKILFHYQAGKIIVETHFTYSNEMKLEELKLIKELYLSAVKHLIIFKKIELWIGL